MPAIPGGQIIGGQGGRIYVGGIDFSPFNLSGHASLTYIDVQQWQIAREWVNAECTHSGTWGAVSRRTVAYDWHFSCTVPLDQSNMPDRVLGFIPQRFVGSSMDPDTKVNVSLCFYLGDVTENQDAIAMKMEQRFYYSPAAIIRAAQPVLDASRDVIRMHITGEGNGRLFLLPNEQIEARHYVEYLRKRGWIK